MTLDPSKLTTPHVDDPANPGFCLPDCARCAEIVRQYEEDIDDNPDSYFVGAFGTGETSEATKREIRELRNRVSDLERKGRP